MAAFPKYHELICNTYTPTFIASSEPCVLQSYPLVTKSRLQAGGTLFRSVKDGGATNVNDIHLQCVVIPISDSGGVVTQSVDFTITDADGIVTNIPTITQTINLSSSPDTCIQSGFAQLRTELSTNNDVEMPEDDSNDIVPTESDPGGSGTGWVIADESLCMLTSFSGFMSGGEVISDVGTGSIRTGPAYTLFNIARAETEDDGGNTDITKLVEWDGDGWIDYPSPLYEPSYDINGNVVAPHPDCPNPAPI